ncbi:hypothetical protein BLNAU_4923 [Blattamonas nauphoetae]|uniref:Uncharacterized protein n=1 Tax=Blattamonas nauphoetae TaxID=2049346 RepID=A0ABQ9Y8H2_9EUKA|nr:hypothetical protein BLNAU_4923 [Blattamonas nauphoetae]
MSFEDKSTLYNSLVALVQAKYPFDNILQERAVRFLYDLEPTWRETDYPDKLIMISFPLQETALSFLYKTIFETVPSLQCHLVKSDLVAKVFATLQPQALPISGNEPIFDNLIKIIDICVDFTSPFSLRKLGITSAADQYNHREMIFQKVVIPSSHFTTFLISNRHIPGARFDFNVLYLLCSFVGISPFHRPILEFVLASPIVMAFSSWLSSAEDVFPLNTILINIRSMPNEWTMEGPESAQSGKRMMQALISEGFENTLEQMMVQDEDGQHGLSFVSYCLSLIQFLGSNVEFTEE